MKRALVAGLAAGLAGPALAQTDFTDLSPAERAIFHAEIREALLGLPELLSGGVPAPAPAPYAEEIESDLARIAAQADALFAPGLPGFGGAEGDAATLALFVQEDCPDCIRAEAELRDITKAYGVKVTLIDMGAHPDLVQALGLDMAPSYVFADKMLRGHIPAIVLERYLSD